MRTKEEKFVEYMVDVKGWTESEAERVFVDVGGAVDEVLSNSDVIELIEFSK